MLRRWESETKKVELPSRKVYVSNVSPLPERVVSAVVAYCCTCPEVGSIGSQSVYNLVKGYGRHFRPHARGQPKSLSEHHIFIIITLLFIILILLFIISLLLFIYQFFVSLSFSGNKMCY